MTRSNRTLRFQSSVTYDESHPRCCRYRGGLITVIERRAGHLNGSIEIVKHSVRDFERGDAQGVVVREMDGVPSLLLAGPATLRFDPGRQRGGRPAYLFGSLESPEIRIERAFDTAIASWNAVTPAGTWLQLDLAVRRTEGRWTHPYTMAVWASGTETLLRHSVGDQDDADARIATDTLHLRDGAVGAAIRYRLTLFTTDPSHTPKVNGIAVVTSASDQLAVDTIASGDGVAWGVELDVPQRSQRADDPASAGWCSPTATSMVLAYWGCSIPIADAAAATYDYLYAGTGNWAFNTAWAGALGFEAFVTRFASLVDVERWIAAGVPVVISLSWRAGELVGAPITSSDGHLIVIRGFDEGGDVIANDPAARSDSEVRQVYHRDQLQRSWLASSGGVAYLIHPPGHAGPELTSGNQRGGEQG